MARACNVCGDELCFDHCVYCGTGGCEDGTAEHAQGCPSETGVFPITEEDFGPKCVECGKGSHGPMFCSECRAEFKLGDHYTHRKVGGGVYEPICLGCAAVEAVSER